MLTLGACRFLESKLRRNGSKRQKVAVASAVGRPMIMRQSKVVTTAPILSKGKFLSENYRDLLLIIARLT